MKIYYININDDEYKFIKENMKVSINEFEIASNFKYLPHVEFSEMLFFKTFINSSHNKINNLYNIEFLEEQLRDVRLLLLKKYSENSDDNFIEKLFKKFDFVNSKEVEIEDISDSYTNDNVIYFKKIKH